MLNGGGVIHREMALGKNRVDICIEWEEQKYPIEIKILQNIRSREENINQILKYMDKTGSSSGWLVIFDRGTRNDSFQCTNKSWDEKLYFTEEEINGKKIFSFGA